MLQAIDDELFFAILDVALDINQALSVQSAEEPVYIDGIRDVIRYHILYPVHAVNHAYRYAELRKKGLMFLQKQSAISSMQFRKTGLSGWDGSWEILVGGANRFDEIMEPLRIEDLRRSTQRKVAPDVHNATARLIQLADCFDRVAVKLRSRRAEREPLLIKDEYDIQYIFAALLETQFDDVRPEEWGPSYAGKATRVDFLLKNESVLFETKMTREGLADGKLGEELIIDINHYKQRAECRTLVCFAYDPDHRIRNPRGFENDLSKRHDHLDVKVIVRPK